MFIQILESCQITAYANRSFLLGPVSCIKPYCSNVCVKKIERNLKIFGHFSVLRRMKNKEPLI